MRTRAEKKAETRRELIVAAIRMSAARGFASLSLREVCREAGLAPTAFYRHFRDMDDLGLALVDEVAVSLRSLMREARRKAEKRGSRVEASVEAFVEYIRRNAHLFRLLLGERLGSSPAFRKALKRETNLFVSELSEDLQRVARLTGYPLSDPLLTSEAIVAVVFSVGAEALDLSGAECRRLIERLMGEVRIILRGSESLARTPWKPHKSNET